MDQAAAKKLHDSIREQERKPWGLLALLVATTSIGPTTLNIVVPALPEIANRLASDITTIQLTVSIYLAGLACGQLIMGPLSDRFGRRPVLLAGLALTTAASVMALSMGTAASMIVARVLQALGASAGVVVSRAVIRDLFDREHAASMIGLVATVMVVVPLFAPLLGGLLIGFGWESIFLFTAVTCAMVMVWASVTLPETRGLNAPQGARAGFFRDLTMLARNPRFAGYVCAAALGSAYFFVFLGAGPHIIITLMERSPAEYGVWFAVGSIGYMAGNYLASRLSTRIGIDQVIWWGIGLEAAGVIITTLTIATVMHWGPAIVMIPQLLIGIGNGLMLPGAISGAISVRPQAAGSASGIVGFTQMALGAAFAQLAGWLIADSASAMSMAWLSDAIVLALAVSFAILVRRR